MSPLPVLEPGVIDVITKHVNSAWARRVGGILLGGPSDGTVTIQAALPARRTDEYQGEIAFLPETWEEAYAKVVDELPGSRIIGWYHSHPGTGTDMSGYDQRLHATLFSDTASVALVVDPVADQRAWYGWVIGRLSDLGPEGTEGDGERDASASTTAGRPSRKDSTRSAAALIALGLVAAGAVGFGVGKASNDGQTFGSLPASSPGTTTSSQQRLREQLRRAQQEVLAGAARMAAIQEQLRAARAELDKARADLQTVQGAGRAQPKAVTYRIRPGDTLWSLAASFYGDGREWTRIWGANRDRLNRPGLLVVGQRVEIPA